MGYIYKITNLINNKVYIGLTTLTIQKRWRSHLKVAYNKNSKDYNALFKKAIRKYGEENFKIEQIDESNNLKELKEKEIYWIKYYNSFAFEEGGWGYNSTRGGDGASGVNDKPIIQCDILSGRKINEYPSLKVGEQKVGCRIESIGQINHSCGGYCFLYKDEVQNLSEEQLIEKVHSLYPTLVYQLDSNGDFVNLYRNTTEAAKAINSAHGNLIWCCLGKRRMVRNYQWAYQRDIKERLGKPMTELPIAGLAVTQYKLSGEKIRDWDNMSIAAKELKIGNSHICSCCKLQRKQAGGYQWRYADEEIESLPPLTTNRKVICLETQEVFNTPNHAAKCFNYSQATVKKCCENGKTTKPYHFAWYDI